MLTLRGTGNTRVRAGAFDVVVAALKKIPALGYTGSSTKTRVLQTRSLRIEKMIGVRATLPK